MDVVHHQTRRNVAKCDPAITGPFRREAGTMSRVTCPRCLKSRPRVFPLELAIITLLTVTDDQLGQAAYAERSTCPEGGFDELPKKSQHDWTERGTRVRGVLISALRDRLPHAVSMAQTAASRAALAKKIRAFAEQHAGNPLLGEYARGMADGLEQAAALVESEDA